MQFDRIPIANKPQGYLDVALAQGRSRAATVKGIRDRTLLLRAKEKERVRAVGKSLEQALLKLHSGYPSFDHLSEFTMRCFETEMDHGRVRMALAGVQGTAGTIRKLTGEHLRMLQLARTEVAVTTMRNAYLGRIGSVLKRLDKHVLVLNEARAVFRRLPQLDESLFTVAIAGFPNVGKSTLLRKMTAAKPEVQPYAFTTKGLNVGYFEHRYNKIQCIDTPGTLNRAKMNDIERKADITVRYLANFIVFVVDPTESEVSLRKQRALYDNIAKLRKPMHVYISKADIASSEVLTRASDEFPSAHIDAQEIAREIVQAFTAWL